VLRAWFFVPGTQHLEARSTRHHAPAFLYVLPSRNALSLRDLDGWRSFLSAFASI
jgi:hypothetical protein